MISKRERAIENAVSKACKALGIPKLRQAFGGKSKPDFVISFNAATPVKTIGSNPKPEFCDICGFYVTKRCDPKKGGCVPF